MALWGKGLFGGTRPAAGERARARALEQAPTGPLRDYLLADPPAADTPVVDLDLLAIDVETTGLDPRRDALLSVGFVPVVRSTVELSGAYHAVVRSQVEVGQSATVHGITDDRVHAGRPIEEVLADTLTALRGRVLVAHFAQIEVGFLTRACREVYGVEPGFTVVDTLTLHRRLLDPHAARELPRGVLRLPAARDHFGLPRYRMHDALVDAIACGELLLAQAAHLGPADQVTLRDLQRE
ncbi:exonuclease domain-containing protein [Arsenicicoccus piscis]|uniref:DNA polymerase III subunit epsilon n=1 Tax=Arsenicicoccus piscis TaxID=673954 RepID=A0ABQ6HTH1_9MICO|nr:exonuclease domain-containing protein [Arsenicicoccus piscis]GMA21820.1 DNA polymerase III subunit epsilon [Arsenicicoccus piscis]